MLLTAAGPTSPTDIMLWGSSHQHAELYLQLVFTLTLFAIMKHRERKITLNVIYYYHEHYCYYYASVL